MSGIEKTLARSRDFSQVRIRIRKGSALIHIDPH